MEDDPGVYAVLIKICRSDSKCKSIRFNATVLKHQQSYEPLTKADKRILPHPTMPSYVSGWYWRLGAC